MLHLTKTPYLVVEVNNREGMEVEKLVKETAINVMQKCVNLNQRKNQDLRFRLYPVIIVEIERDWHN